MKIGKQEVEVKIGAGVTGTPIAGLVPKKKTEKSRKTLKTGAKDKSRISHEAKESESGKAKKSRLNSITAEILKMAPKVKVVDTAKMSEKEAQKALKSADIIHIMPKGRQSDLGEIAQDSLTEKQDKTVVIVDKMSDKEIEKAVAEGKTVVKAVPGETGKKPENQGTKSADGLLSLLPKDQIEKNQQQKQVLAEAIKSPRPEAYLMGTASLQTIGQALRGKSRKPAPEGSVKNMVEAFSRLEDKNIGKDIEIQPLSMPDHSASYEIKEKAEQILNSDSIGDKKQNPRIFANGKEVDRKGTYKVKFHEHPNGWSGPAGE